MIISHRHRFIFFAVPRTATHSIRRALRPQLAPGDWEQQQLHGAQHVPIPDIAAVGHGHVSAAQAAAALPDSVWRDYFKFAFVRDPFDRFVSTCCFLNRGNPAFPGRETRIMKELLARPQFRRRVLVRPQAELLTGRDGLPAMDYVGRYETLAEDFAAVCERLGLPCVALSVHNASARDAAPSYYDRELERAVADLYRPDFDLFGYPPRLRRLARASGCG